jgi:hypothetical protein
MRTKPFLKRVNGGPCLGDLLNRNFLLCRLPELYYSAPEVTEAELPQESGVVHENSDLG